MWHFHVKRCWFDKIKNGSKNTEYRFLTPRLEKQLNKDSLCHGGWSKIRFYCGYPKKDDSSKILDASLFAVHFVYFYSLPSDVRAFFLKQKNNVQLFDYSVFVAFEFGDLQ